MPSETMNRREGACTCSASQPLDGNNATELARRNIGAPARCACAAVRATTLVALGGCSENGAVGKTVNPSGSQSQTSGPAYERPELGLSPFDQAAAGGENGVSIDASNLAKGYVAVSATASTRLKFQISFEGSETQYYFDLPSDGTPISCPLVQGSGAYTFTVWENTTGQRYSELYSLADQPVTLADRASTATTTHPAKARSWRTTCPPTPRTRATWCAGSTTGSLKISHTTRTKPLGLPMRRATFPTPIRASPTARASASTTHRWRPPCCAAKGSPAR